jgi:hypothetical protein
MKEIATKFLVILALTLLASVNVFSQEQKNQMKPVVIKPAKRNKPPSDAVILFDRGNLNQFSSVKDSTSVPWKVRGAVFTVVPGTGNIQTKQLFGDIQLHIEFKIPKSAKKRVGQKSGNSGIYLMGKYEVQVLNSFGNETYPKGQAGAVYEQYAPLVNASLKPGKWQVYDIVFEAPEFNNNGSLTKSPYLTVFHNGVLIQNHVKVLDPTTSYNKELPEKAVKGPIMLQEHNNAVSYRNIWVRKL